MIPVTVNLISYFYGHLAAHAIESVLSQTVRPCIVRFYDDAAGDCAHLARLYPEVEFIHRPENLGIVGNLNDALARTTTERCIVLGADNYLRPDALEKMYEQDADIVSSDIAIFGQDTAAFKKLVGSNETSVGFPLWRFSKGEIEKWNYIHGSSLYRTQKAKDAGGYKASGRQNSEEDWMLWRAMLRNGGTHKHVAEALLYYRRHRKNFQKTT